MRQNTDYKISLKPVTAKDAADNDVAKLDGEVIPAGYSGEFLLTVEGQKNYTEIINKTIDVTDKKRLMKNAVITLGANQKNVKYKGEPVTLMPEGLILKIGSLS